MSTIQVRDIDTNSDEYKLMLNDMETYAGTFASGFITRLFSNGIITEVTAEQLKKYFANPDLYQQEIENLAQYFYISSPDIHMLFEMIESLPTLNYRIESFKKTEASDKHEMAIHKQLKKVQHRRLTRDILKQTAASGNVVGMWLGDKKNPHAYIFDDTRYAQPLYRKNNDWTCVLDLRFFNSFNDEQRKLMFRMFTPYVTQQHYDEFKKDPDKQYVELPQERTFSITTGALKRNQSKGTSWITSGLFDVQHKKKLKDVERSIANKIINAVAVVTIGSDKNNGKYSNLELNKAIKQKIHGGVKSALEANNKDGVNVVSIPDFASIEFPDVKVDGLDGKKFDHINKDIESSYGLLSSTGDNYASGNTKLDLFYKRLGVMLEDVENIYQKLINLIVPDSQLDNYSIIYDKEKPLSAKEIIEVLTKLVDKGFSIKHLVDKLPGVNWDTFLEQTLYETDVLHLQEKIKPYMTSSVMSGNAGKGSSSETSENPNTIKSATTDSNNTPSE